MKFGVRLPTSMSGEIPDASALFAYVELIDELTFDSVWALDQMVTPDGHFSSAWLDPFVVLAICAAASRRLQLGTAVLALPVRRALDVAVGLRTMQALAGGRVVLGVGAGWDRNVMQLADVDANPKRLGLQMERVLTEVMRVAHAESAFGPLSTMTMPVWVAGGAVSANGDIHLSEASVKRIARSEGWLLPGRRVRSDAVEAAVRRMREVRRAEFGFGQGAEFAVGMSQFVLLEPSDASAFSTFRSCMAPGRTWSELRESYWIGSGDEICSEICQLSRAGVDRFILTPATTSQDELVRLVAEVVEPCIAWHRGARTPR